MTTRPLSRRALLAGAAATSVLGAAPTRGLAQAGGLKPAVDRETLVIGLQRGFATLDATAAVTSDSDRYNWQIFDSLYGFDPHGNLVPRLATGYEVSDDGLSYTYRLREGVRFHNGVELTSADVRFSLDHILNPVNKSTRRLQFAPFVEKVETPDPRTVVFHLKAPEGVFANRVAGYLPIIPATYETTLSETEFFSVSPVSAGPYKVKTFTRDGHYLELERFEDFWGEKPAVKRLIYKVIPEASNRTNALLAGEIDIAVGLPFQDIDRLKADARFDTLPTPVGSPWIIKPVTTDPSLPFAKREVRLAANYAIDKAAIIRSVLRGAGEPLASITSRYYPYGVDPNLKAFPYDPAKAKQLLAAAGYPGGFQTKLFAGNDHPKELVEAVAAYWSQVGIRADIQILDYATWVARSNAKQLPPMTLQQMANALFDPAHPVIGVFAKDGFSSTYYNPEVEAVIQEVIPAVGPQKRGALFEKANRLIHDDAGVIFLSELYQVYAKKKDVVWEPFKGSAILNFRKAGWAA